jgi:hypothetical protein
LTVVPAGDVAVPPSTTTTVTTKPAKPRLDHVDAMRPIKQAGVGSTSPPAPAWPSAAR